MNLFQKLNLPEVRITRNEDSTYSKKYHSSIDPVDYSRQFTTVRQEKVI